MTMTLLGGYFQKLTWNSEMLHKFLSNKNIRIPIKKVFENPPTPRTMTLLGGQKSHPRIPKLLIWLLRGWGKCADRLARTSIGMSGNSSLCSPNLILYHSIFRHKCGFTHLNADLWPESTLWHFVCHFYILYIGHLIGYSWILYSDKMGVCSP